MADDAQVSHTDFPCFVFRLIVCPRYLLMGGFFGGKAGGESGGSRSSGVGSGSGSSNTMTGLLLLPDGL